MDLDAAKQQLFQHLSWEVRDERVIDAMKRVPREEFVPEEQRPFAYADRPLSIGHGQTISQPYIIALMIRALEIEPTDRILELGAGSGYVAAILGELAGKVVSVEIVPELAHAAQAVLSRLEYHNVEVHTVPRTRLGWIDDAPYDGILVSAGAPNVPQMLLGQLKWHGRLVIPVGSRWQQDLIRITHLPEGDEVENLGACYFVPLIGEGAWKE